MQRNGAEIVIDLLQALGVRTVAGVPGGAILPLYDALLESRIGHVLARHEQGAGFIAQGMARATGKAGVCLATSGPGVTNLITAVADAKLDSIPLVAITAQVPQSLIGTDAFQEVDTYGLSAPITKHNFFARSARELLKIIPEAFRIAESGRRGPVWVDIPKDVLTETATFDRYEIDRGSPSVSTHSAPSASPSAPMPVSILEEFVKALAAAKRPVILAGGGVIAADAADTLCRLARRLEIPVASTLAGLGAFPADDPLWIGMVGMHGAPYTNMLLAEADLLLAVGVRFDDRATGKASEFCARAKILHVDIDAAEIGKIKTPTLALNADAGEALRVLLARTTPCRRELWSAHVQGLRRKHPLRWPDHGGLTHPLNLVRTLSELLGPDDVLTTDVGQHQMWLAQAYPFKRPRTLLTSGGLGTMGFGLPAAIGAALATGRRVVCFSGDGSFLMNLQELATLAELRLPIVVIVMNNRQHGLVRQQQELFYRARFHACRFERRTDFVTIAGGFGIAAHDLGSSPSPAETLERALVAGGPCMIDVPVSETANVLPMVPPGMGNHEMIREVSGV